MLCQIVSVKDICLFWPCPEAIPYFTAHCGNRKPHPSVLAAGWETCAPRRWGSLFVSDKVPGFQLMWCLGVKDSALGHEDTSFSVSSEPLGTLCLPPHIHSLPFPYCSVPGRFWLGSGMGGTLGRDRGASREWSSVFVTLPSHQHSGTLLKGKAPAHPVCWLASPNSKNSCFLLPLQAKEWKNSFPPPSFCHWGTEFILCYFLQFFPHLIL